MTNNFYLSLRTQYENLGDYLIAQATIDQLAQYGNIVLDVRKVPDYYLQLFDLPPNVSIVKRDFLLTLLSSPRAAWTYVVKPGGHSASHSMFQKYRTFLMASYFLTAKKLFGVTLIKMPHSFNDQPTAPDLFYHKQFDLNLCRDQNTFDIYQHNHLPNLRLFPDFAMYYAGRTSKFISPVDVPRTNIAISLRYDRLGNEPEIAYQMAEMLLSDKTKADEIVFVSQVTLDDPLNAEVSQLHAKRHIRYSIDRSSIKEISMAYKSSRYVISNRLHALLLGLLNGAIPVALIDLEKDRKILGCLDFFDIPWVDKNHLQHDSSYLETIHTYSYAPDQNLFSDFDTLIQSTLAKAGHPHE